MPHYKTVSVDNNWYFEKPYKGRMSWARCSSGIYTDSNGMRFNKPYYGTNVPRWDSAYNGNPGGTAWRGKEWNSIPAETQKLNGYNGIPIASSGTCCASLRRICTIDQSVYVPTVCPEGFADIANNGTCVKTVLSCPVGLILDQATARCVTNPTCPVSAGWSATFDGGIDKCKTLHLKNCPAGMIYDVVSSMCAKSADCNNSKATLNTASDKCVMAVGECGSWAFDTSINACYSDPTCNQGVFNYLKNRCEAVIAQECGTYSYDSNASKCVLPVSCPIDDVFEEKASVAFSSELNKCVSQAKHTCLVNYAYNGLPIVMCEAVPICVRGVYQPQLDSCFLNNYTCPIGSYECRVTTGIEAWCSPYDCVEDYCRLAMCPDLQMAKDGISDPSACSEIVCDASKPYNGHCGKDDCPSGYGIFKENGKCYQSVCPQGAIEQPDGSCQTLQCPAGTTEVDGKCLVNQ
jgi:conjugal transfer mating pair stabilization protein TraN